MRDKLLEKYLISDREFSAIGRLLMDARTTLASLCEATGKGPDITYCIAQCVAHEFFGESISELNNEFYLSALPFLSEREGETVAKLERQRIMKMIRSKSEDMCSLVEESAKKNTSRQLM